MAAVADTLELSLDELKPHPQNARTHDLAVIRESLERHGQFRAIVARRAGRGKHTILAGHGTWEAARDLGWERLLVHLIDCDAEQAKRILLVDNRANDHAGYDQRALLELLGGLPDLEGTGYDDDSLADLDALVRQLDPAERPPDEAPPLPTEPTTKPGDLFQLGEHRLLCGDATSATDIARLIADEPAHLMWTDPPYGVAYVGGTANKLTIRNDARNPGALAELLRDAFAMADTALREGAAIYVAHPAGALSVTFGSCFVEQGWRLHQTLVWVKDAMVLGHSDYHYKHEPILLGEKDDAPDIGDEHVPITYGYTPGGGRRGRGGDGWQGDNKQVSVLTVPRPKTSREHPTMKPLELIEVGIRNSSRPRDVVLDPFAGSGSTLMACEFLTRKARLMELDPRYCDVIVKRWEGHTGAKAELVEA